MGRGLAWLLIGVACLWGGAGPLSACAPQDEDAEQAVDDAVEDAKARVPYDLLTTDRLTGDWCGRRTCLEERGITVEWSVTTYLQGVARGGSSTNGAWSFAGSSDLELTFDLGAMKAVSGGTVYLWATTSWGESPTTHGWVEDLFFVNGGEIGDRPIDVQELWYEQALLDGKLKVRLGKLSLPYSFDVNAFAWDPYTQFLNYGLNNAPNIPFPANAFGALGIQAMATPCDSFYFGAAVADADADFNEVGVSTAFHGPANFFSICEAGWTPTFDTRRGKLPGHYRAGLWYQSGAKDEFYDSMGGAIPDAPQKHGDVGFYLNFDQVVSREKPCEEENEEGLGVFARYSYAPGDVNLIEHFWSLGAQYRGLVPGRDDDVLGVGIGQGFLSGESRLAGYPSGSETAIEAYYGIQVLPWMTVSPDVQWILNPGGAGRDAWVIGLRVGITF